MNKILLASLLCLSLLIGCGGERNKEVLTSLRSQGVKPVTLIVATRHWQEALNRGVVVPNGVNVTSQDNSHTAIVGSANDVGLVYLQIFPPISGEDTTGGPEAQ